MRRVLVALIAAGGALACHTIKPLPPGATLAEPSPFDGATAGEARPIAGLPLRWCPAGTFVMGSPPSERERRSGEDQVEVMVSKGFWAGEHEVTQGEWQRVVGAFPAELNVGAAGDLPMYRVTFAEAEDFCRRVTDLAHASGELPGDWEFRLPTEAQWEYSARAGTSAATSFGDSLSSTQANFRGQPYNGAAPGPSIDKPVPIGSYPPNPWGLYDVHGNVFEWTRDWAHDQLPGGVDPDLYSVPGTPNRDGTQARMRRGGCYADEGWACRSAMRVRFEPERRHEHIGFRVFAVRP
ncbi:MAG TPA: formylglycine-generating enzyme family protein [Myxococcaceae bacterium]|jgi:formylglycine-generating enzyme required for sulfatase activity